MCLVPCVMKCKKSVALEKGKRKKRAVLGESLGLREFMGFTKTTTKQNSEPEASVERGFPCQRPRMLPVSCGLEKRPVPSTAENTSVECVRCKSELSWGGGAGVLTDAQGLSCSGGMNGAQ